VIDAETKWMKVMFQKARLKIQGFGNEGQKRLGWGEGFQKESRSQDRKHSRKGMM